MEVINLFVLINASQGFLFGFAILFSPFFKNNINQYLGYSILVLSLLMFNIFLDNIGFFDTYPWLEIIDDIEWIFLFPVFFFFYLLKSIGLDLIKNKQLNLLYIPIFFSFVINSISMIEDCYFLSILKDQNSELIPDWVFGIEQIGYYLFNVILLLWSYRLLKKYHDVDELIKWLKSLWSLVFFLTMAWIVLDIIDIATSELNSQLYSSILSIGLCFFMYWIAYNGVYKLKLANDRRDILKILEKASIDKKIDQETLKTYEQKDPSAINPFSESNIYFKKLEFLLTKEFIYRNPDLSREVIAEKLEISTGYLSQIINSITQRNFTSYINSFRVEEVKKMILNSEFNKYSLLAIGLEAGFQSKTTFYSAFKKETGLTPSQFKNKYKEVRIS